MIGSVWPKYARRYVFLAGIPRTADKRLRAQLIGGYNRRVRTRAYEIRSVCLYTGGEKTKMYGTAAEP